MMASVSEEGAPRAGFRPSFHLWMVLLMCGFVFLGFGMTYLVPTATGTRSGDPPVVHLHGITFFSWMVLLLVQALLVNVKQVKLHRSLGTFGIAIGTLVVFMGWMITIVGASTTTLSGDGAAVFFLSVVAPLTFAVIFVMAIRAVRKPQVHRDLILIATISILMPGINRVYMELFSLGRTPIYETYATMDVLLAAVLFHAWKVHGEVGRARWIAAAVVVVPQFLNPLVSGTEGWAEFVYWLGDFVYYREALAVS